MAERAANLTEDQKNIIRELYANQGLTLKPCQEACRSIHGFEITEKQYYKLRQTDKGTDLDWDTKRAEKVREGQDLREKAYQDNARVALNHQRSIQAKLAQKLEDQADQDEMNFEQLKCIKIALEANKLLTVQATVKSAAGSAEEEKDAKDEIEADEFTEAVKEDLIELEDDDLQGLIKYA